MIGRKGIFLLLFAFAFTGGVRGQSIPDASELDPFFQSWGASTFIDVIRGPATSYETPSGRKDYFQSQGFSYLTAAYRGRMNLAELFEDMALSSSLTPAIGASFFRSGYLHFNLPMQVNLEIGAKATKSASLKRFGIVAGVGYEFHAAPLIVNRSRIQVPRNTNFENTWLQPVYMVGVRYKRGGRLMELNLKYGQGDDELIGGRVVPPTQTIRVMAFYYI